MKISELYKFINKAAIISKTKAYFVGGYVRDRLMGIKTKDADIVVVGDADSFASELKKILRCQYLKHERFGTFIFSDLVGGSRLDIASARRETYVSPAALPTVILGATINEDLSRRDFTINAIAMKPMGARERIMKNSLLDPFNGYSDIEKKLIRVLHKNSFIDDPTRILRAARFSVRFNFKIERFTKRLIKKAKQNGCIKKLTPARLGKELLAIFNEKNSGDVFKTLRRWGVLGEFFPELSSVRFAGLNSGTAVKKLKKISAVLPSKKEFLDKYQFSRELKRLI